MEIENLTKEELFVKNRTEAKEEIEKSIKTTNNKYLSKLKKEHPNPFTTFDFKGLDNKATHEVLINYIADLQAQLDETNQELIRQQKITADMFDLVGKSLDLIVKSVNA